MDFTSIGSIGAFTRTWKMQAQWKQKKETGNLLRKEKRASREEMSPKDAELASIKEQLDRMKESKDEDLENIRLKLQCGKELSYDELEYLRAKDPAAYQEAKEIAAERESYKRELKKCRTKEDVERLNTARLGNTLTQIHAIAHNPAIPKLQKMKLFMKENAKLNAVMEEKRLFVESGKYAKLPTEEERNEEIRERHDEKNVDADVEKTDAEKTDDEKTDAGKTDDEKTDAGKTDIGKTDAGKTDIGKTDDGKTDIGKTDDGKTDTGKTDIGKTDIGKTDIGKTDAGIADGERAGGVKKAAEVPNYRRAAAAYREMMTGQTEINGPGQGKEKRVRKRKA